MQQHASRNFDLRDEIKDYWGKRAASFDSQPGHEIFSDAERHAWQALFRRHLGPGKSSTGDELKALDLASGTGVISHILRDLEFDVTGMDWCEPMLELARQKTADRASGIRFLQGDAENTLEPDNHYDVLTCRHLVWTLVDPEAAFKEWFRILKPTGKLLIVDGDFVNPSLVSRVTKLLAPVCARLCMTKTAAETSQQSAEMQAAHASILQRVYFSKGARAEAIATLLKDAGFTSIRIEKGLGKINREQAKNFPFWKALERRSQHRYAISATKPESA